PFELDILVFFPEWYRCMKMFLIPEVEDVDRLEYPVGFPTCCPVTRGVFGFKPRTSASCALFRAAKTLLNPVVYGDCGGILLVRIKIALRLEKRSHMLSGVMLSDAYRESSMKFTEFMCNNSCIAPDESC